MPLTNFGSILNFAEALEKEDAAFYADVSQNPACAEHQGMFAQFAKDGKKNVKIAQRTRRENVTEMILEPIKDFARTPFMIVRGDGSAMDAAEALATARRLEERAENYYKEAAEKIKTQPEVSRALKTMGKKHAAHLQKLSAV